MKNSLNHIECFIFDLDGTIYCGDSLFEGVHEVFAELQNHKKKCVFLTNNSSKSGETYVEKLLNMGFSWVQKKHIITSGDILIDYAHSQNFKHVVVVGNHDFTNQWEQDGFDIVTEKNTNVDAVIIGFDTDVTYKKLELATHYARKGIPLLATNEDVVCPMPQNEYIPDCGAITALIERASGKRATYFGKPQLSAVSYINKYLHLAPNQLCMIGDRLYTDIKMGEHGLTTILVLSGETKREHLTNSNTQPTIVCNSVRDICSML